MKMVTRIKLLNIFGDSYVAFIVVEQTIRNLSL